MYTQMPDLLTVAQDEWTPSQFRDKLIYQALLKAMTGEVQKIEDTLLEMYQERSLPDAEGVQLDNVGTNMGVTRRLGQTDDEYRTAIYAEIFARRSDGSSNYVMNALKSIYKSTTSKIFEHMTLMTGGVVVVVNQINKMPTSVPILKRMVAVAIQSVVILRDPTPQGYAWTPVEVVGDTSALVDNNQDWFITDGGLGVVVQTGSGQLIKKHIGSFGEPGLLSTPLGLDSTVGGKGKLVDGDTLIDAKGQMGGQYLQVQKRIPNGGVFGIMAEVSQLRKGHTNIEGEQ